MDRRSLLKGLGASALAAGAPRALLAAPPRKVIVIGAGIVGAGIAYELAKRGTEVILLERTAPAAGTTKDSYAYLNASTKSGSQPYFQLNWLGMAGWRVWQQERGEVLPVRWGGAVYWRDAAAEGALLAASREQVRRWGYAAESLDAAGVDRLLPTLRTPTVAEAAFFPEEGALDPVGAVAALLARAKRLGVQVRYPVAVTDLIVEDGEARGVRTPAGEIRADTVVLAAGLGSRALAEARGGKLPLNPSSGILLHTRPYRPVVDRLVFAPTASVRQMLDGRILASIGHEGASADGAAPGDVGKAILGAATTYLPQLRGAAIDRVSVGQRVMPADGFPIVGFLPATKRLYVAVTHSGVTLAPVIGRLAASEILDGSLAPQLALFRPDRFA